MSVKQAKDTRIINNNNDVLITSTLNEVLIASNNETTQNMAVNSNLISNTMKVNNLTTNGFVYSNSVGTLSNTAPSNYISQEASAQNIIPNTPTLIQFNTTTSLINNIGMGYNAGLFINTNTTRILTCSISYSIAFAPNNNVGSRSVYIYSTSGPNAGLRQSPANNDALILTGSTIFIIKPNETFGIYCSQSSLATTPITGSIEILVF